MAPTELSDEEMLRVAAIETIRSWMSTELVGMQIDKAAGRPEYITVREARLDRLRHLLVLANTWPPVTAAAPAAEAPQ